jgi:16S rRNA C1402 N4-methylase RsmH
VESRLFELDRRTRTTAAPQDFDTQVGQFVQQVIRSVDADMRRQPASMVYQLLRIHVARRLPGIEVDQELLRDAAAKIAAGYPV